MKYMGIYEVTEEQFKTAESNGIKYRTLYHRILPKLHGGLGWDLETAINTPLTKKKRIDKALIEKAEKNGISYLTLRTRITRGWDIQTAATKPVRKLVTH